MRWNLALSISFQHTSVKAFFKPSLENETLSNILSYFLMKMNKSKPQEADSSLNSIWQVSSSNSTATPHIEVNSTNYPFNKKTSIMAILHQLTILETGSLTKLIHSKFFSCCLTMSWRYGLDYDFCGARYCIL